MVSPRILSSTFFILCSSFRRKGGTFPVKVNLIMIRCSISEQNLNFFAYLSLFIFSFCQPFFLPYSDIELADHLKLLVACSFIFLYLYPCSFFPGMPFSLRALSYQDSFLPPIPDYSLNLVHPST